MFELSVFCRTSNQREQILSILKKELPAFGKELVHFQHPDFDDVQVWVDNENSGITAINSRGQDIDDVSAPEH